MPFQSPTVFLLAITLGFLQPATAFADRADSQGPERRVLGGHQFQPLHRLPDPFVTTHIRTATGAGVATGFESPFVDTAGDTVGTLTGDLVFFSLAFEYQQNLFQWAAVRLELSGTGRAGIDEQSVLADGLNTVYGAVLQGKAAVLQVERSTVTILATFSRKNIFGLDPFGFAQSVVDSGLGKDNSLVLEANIHRFSAGAAAAYAFRPWLGATCSVELGSAKPVDEDASNETLFKAGVAGDFDLFPLKEVGLGFTLAYDYDSFPEGGADVAKGIHSGTLGVNYTGRRDFHVGLETVLSTLKQTDIESTFASTSFLLNLRYYF